ncbi:cob(I)yrinic acid a,c-diamide adenosyltransferase [Halarchaeum sp. P4]|uniref:cob(I)yrinic acid a,c-diamide adenosyltransferase n=1 Tax=Halarchaeum sp. P4 TaxID=3421639 RepID=UPI003EC14E9A
MTIYTGRGDEGRTDLRGAERVSKTDARIEAYGTVDEVNSLLGVVAPTGYDDVDEALTAAQNHLHIAQADLATPDPDNGDHRVQESHVEEVESWIDDADEELDPLTNFVLPGGSEAGAKLHHARSVARRAERRAVALAEEEAVNETVVVYLNRLSDALFTLARLVNAREGVHEDEPTY